ncbi:MAG: hypothetical protein ABI868_06060 [Acidobacteriota bacterium]
MSGRRSERRPSGLREHSLSLLLSALLALLFLLYARSDPRTHLGAFFGNAIADWLGVLVFVIATKYFVEIGSGESRKPSAHFHVRIWQLLMDHSLTLVLAVTGVGWLVVYRRSDVDSKWGQVIGNVLSDWSQVLGMVLITKYARERGSKEGA